MNRGIASGKVGGPVGEESLTRKRLTGLIQLLERDLDGKPRNAGGQMHIVDEIAIV